MGIFTLIETRAFFLGANGVEVSKTTTSMAETLLATSRGFSLVKLEPTFTTGA